MEYESAHPKQEPFCYHDGRNIVGKEFADHSDVFPLYTSPQPRQWQWLTREDWAAIGCKTKNEMFVGLDVAAKLREKNTGETK